MDRDNIAAFLQMILLSYTEYLILKLNFSISKGYFCVEFQGSSVAMVQTTDVTFLLC